VQGTTLHCLRRLNPALECEEEPWMDPTPALASALDVAQRCPAFRAGAPAWLDCELEELPVTRARGTPYTAADMAAYAAFDVRQSLADFLNAL